MIMTRIRLRYVTADIDRHGNARYYFRRRGLKNKTRLPGLPGSDEFMEAYQAALAGRPAPRRERLAASARAESGTLDWLIQQYLGSTEFKTGLDGRTRKSRRVYLETIAKEPLSASKPMPIGAAPYAGMTQQIVRALLDRKADTPAAANAWRKSLSVLYGWAMERYPETVRLNPVIGIKKLKGSPDGWHTWTKEEVSRYEARHPVGTKARLAFALLLYTGQRREDVISFGRHLISDGKLTFTQNKNRNKSPVRMEIPILPELQAVVSATPAPDAALTFLVNEWGRPYSGRGFAYAFKRWCTEAGLPHCSAHGMRKAGATLAAGAGATTHELMAIFGWTNIAQAELYTREADRKKLAAGSMHFLAARGERR